MNLKQFGVTEIADLVKLAKVVARAMSPRPQLFAAMPFQDTVAISEDGIAKTTSLCSGLNLQTWILQTLKARTRKCSPRSWTTILSRWTRW